MTHKVTVRFGGAVDSEVHDYSDRVRLLGDGTPLIHGGMSCDNGSASMGELILDDEQNDIPHRTDPPGLQLAAHNQLIWSEDSPGYESWLSIGRIDNKNVGRPYERTADVNRQWTVQWADANIDLDGLTLTEDWVRPAETDVDRVLAAIAAFCNGSPRLTTVFETHLVSSSGAVTMPAKTYEAGTELPELFDDCATQAGKTYSVVIHDQDSASHTCFLYIDEEDHTTYPCTLSISDQVSEVDGESVFEPHWRQGGATLEQGQELVSGLVSRYGMDTTATAFVSDTAHVNSYDWWVKPFNDDLAVTAAQATTRVTAMVHSRGTEHLTHQPSILIPARLHYLIKAGMSIPVKSAAMMGGQYLGTVQTRRIANIEWAHAGWTDEPLLWANLQLDRTPRKLPLSIGVKPGPQPPTAGSAPGVAASGGTYNYSNGGFLLKDGLDVAGADDDMLIVFVTARDGQPTTAVKWIPDTASSGTFDSFTLIDTATVGSPAVEVTAWKLYGPSPSVASRIFVTQGGSNRATSGAWYYVKGVSSATVLEAEDTNAGAGVTATVAGVNGGHLLLDGVGWQATHSAALTATAGADQTQDYQNGQAGAFGDPDAVLAVSHQLGSAGGVMSWSTIPSSANYSGAAHVAIALLGQAADSPPPAADDGTGSIGDPTTGCYATCDHKHPVQTAAVTPITDSGGNFTATNVEDALAETADALDAHLADGTDAHDASAISVADAGGYFSSATVEGALQELGAGGGGGGGSNPFPVQEKASGQAQNVSSYSLVMDSTPTNNMLLAWACEDSTTTISGISQTGVTWTRLNRTVVNGFGHELWFGTGTASTATVSVTMSASQWSHCAVVELNGLTGTLSNTQSGSGRAVMLRSTATTTAWIAQARNSGGGGFASVINVGAPNLFPIMQDRNGAIWVILEPATLRNAVIMPGADGTAQTAILWAVD